MFSKLYLTNAYQELLLEEDSLLLTLARGYIDIQDYHSGWRQCQQSFKRLWTVPSKVLKGSCVILMSDVLITSSTREQHL